MTSKKMILVTPEYWQWMNVLLDTYIGIIDDMPGTGGLADMLDDDAYREIMGLWIAVQTGKQQAFREIEYDE